MTSPHLRLSGAIAAALAAHGAHAQIDDPFPDPILPGNQRIELVPVATGLTAPVVAVAAPGQPDTLYICDQVGLVHLLRGGAVLPQPFLDVRALLVDLGVFGSGDENDFDERGLLGLAFHPGFANPDSPGHRRLYTYTSEPYTSPGDFTTEPPPSGVTWDHHNVVTEWRVDAANPDRVDPASRRILYREDHPQFNHNGGMIAFGPDGFLYIADGDGGGADDDNGEPFLGPDTWGHGPDGNGQDLTRVLGKILRIDPLGTNSANGRYGIPADNPFVNAAGLDEIWAYGLRNPYRFSFDRADGRLIVGDVGQNEIEEINIIQRAGNYGWRVKEGTFLFTSDGANPGFIFQDSPGNPPGLIDPVIQYDHDEGLSVIGGYVYRGTALPELTGRYITGDFSRRFPTPLGRLFLASLEAGTIEEFRIGTVDRPLGYFLKGFGEDAFGEVYACVSRVLGPAGNQGAVLRMVPARVCPADFDRSGTVDTDDFFDFLNAFYAGQGAADINHDLRIDSDDFFDFLNAFYTPCP